jgi:hypothetical protein
MQDVEAGTIVPSTRDLFQAIGTRRRNLALVGLIGGERASDDAARLADLNVSAFACVETGPAMAQASRATKTVPMLCLHLASERDHFVAARQHGADGVCIDARAAVADWDRLALAARTMRMAPLSVATDAAGVAAGVKMGARALLVRAPSAAQIVELVADVPRSVMLLAMVEGADAEAVRALVGKVDAVVVPPAVHSSPSFAELVAEVDP